MLWGILLIGSAVGFMVSSMAWFFVHLQWIPRPIPPDERRDAQVATFGSMALMAAALIGLAITK